jgi:hypothetical protein
MQVRDGAGDAGSNRFARACVLVLGVAVAWAAESYESDLNVARPAVLAVTAPAPPRPRAGARRLVWVFADGLRLDESRRMPVVNRLRAEGLDVAARAEFPTYSGPNFIAQASGLEPAVSGALSNGYPGELELDSIFRRARLAGYRTTIVTTDDDDSLSEVYKSWVDETHVSDSLARVPSGDVVLVHIGQPDWTAHDYGTRSPEYRGAVADVDAFVGRVVAALDPAHDVIVFTSDHGNLLEGGHGGTEAEVVKIPIVLWGAGVPRGHKREVGRARDVAPTIASLLGVGPLCHATGRSLVGEDEATARQRAAVCDLVGNAGRRPTHYIPMTILIAVVTLALLGRRSELARRALLTAPTYALVFAGLIAATHTVSFSVSNLSAQFGIRLTVLCAIAGLAQMLVGGRPSLAPAAFATSLAVLAVATVAAFQPLAPVNGMFRFLPIPALTSLAFICLVTAAVGIPESGTWAVPREPSAEDVDVVAGTALHAGRGGGAPALVTLDRPEESTPQT